MRRSKRPTNGARLPPVQKLRRELWRIGRQIDRLLFNIAGLNFTNIYYRIFITPHVSKKPGSLAFGRRVAIYLIYPGQGFLASHRIALRYIARCGYSPVVVSNLPLEPQDEAEVLKLSAALILRPNFGYDFGGYRDAIQLMKADIPDLEYLVILNDSSWFPVHPEIDWFGEAEQKQLDFVGSVFHYGIEATRVLDFARTPWSINRAAPMFHYGSYSILIGPRILADPGFLKFWDHYQPTDYKQQTIKLGEIGLTQWVLRHGYSHGATCDTEHLDQLLDDLPTERLLEIAENLVTPIYAELNAMRVAVVAINPPDRTALRNLILAAVARQGPGYALIDFDVRNRKGNFIKKSPIVLNRVSAAQTMRVLGQLDSPEVAVFRQEIRERFQRKFGEVLSETQADLE